MGLMKYYHIKYCDPHSLFIINSKGRLRRIYTPFRVLCLKDIGDIPESTEVYIEEVASTDKDELVYYVAGVAYKYDCFRILAKF